MNMGIIIGLFSNVLGLWVAQYYVAGFVVLGGLKGYLIAGILLGLLNLIVRPILKLVSLPLVILTLGLFNIVISLVLVWIVASVTGYIVIQSLYALFLATIIIALVNFIGHLFSNV